MSTPPYYKSAILETLYAFADYCAQNAGAILGEVINLGQVLELAAACYVREKEFDASSRYIDIFIEQSPVTLQIYVHKVLKSLDRSEE